MKNPNKITCPQCRASMRLWALDSRSPEIAGDQNTINICLCAAMLFRDGPCFHQGVSPSTSSNWAIERGTAEIKTMAIHSARQALPVKTQSQDSQMSRQVQGFRSLVNAGARRAAWLALWVIVLVMLARLLDIAWETARYALDLWVHTPEF